MALRTEDEVRNSAGTILGFVDEHGSNVETDSAISGVGQLTTFNELGKRLGASEFLKCKYKPDGWYLPKKPNDAAIILETKSEKEDLMNPKWEKELLRNVGIALARYVNVVGILYNGIDVRVFVGKTELALASDAKLQGLEYYTGLFAKNTIDKKRIYEVTKRINDSLHFDFGVISLQDRMIFTACALVAQRYNPVNGLQKLKDMDYSTFQNWIYNALAKAIEKDKKQNTKLEVLLEEYSHIRMSITENQTAINGFIDNVCEIAELVNSDFWNGEDVMAIFFNEFNRYKSKTDAGQVFTPDHITSFMYRLIGVSKSDRVLDAACGSGAFLVKAMCNMIKEVGGRKAKEVRGIQEERLFGIEMYSNIFALACANMLIHKDGKSNLAQMDATTKEASEWIKSKNITKVLMNPPFERKYKCMAIVKNVLDSVPKATKCAFILPDKKLEKDFTHKTYGNKILKDHTLTTIIKLPENLFFNKGVTTSIFVFETGEPQGTKNIIGYYIKDDGLETVKNQGRQDIRNRWKDIEDYWINAIYDGNDSLYGTRQIIKPSEHLSYQATEKKFTVSEEDFTKTMMDYIMFKRGIDAKAFSEALVKKIMYSSNVVASDNKVTISLDDKEVDNCG